MYPSPHLRLRCWLAMLAVALVALGGCEETNVTTVGAAQVSISPPSASVKVGETTLLTAAVLSSDGVPLTGRTIQWTSLDQGRASVDNTGLVRGLAVGLARIQASAEGATATANVTVTSGPALAASPGTVEFSAIRNGANPGDRVVAITNSGDGTLNGLAVSVTYPVGGASGWLSASLAGSTAPSTLVLGATVGSLAVGTYSATVTITSPVASNSPLVVPVQLQVQAPAAAIALGATNVGFNAVQGGANPNSQTVAVTNAGGGTLSGLGVSVTYSAGQPTGWLNATLAASTAPTTVTLAAVTGALPAGSYTATVRVASAAAVNSPQNITVSFTVGAAPPVIGAQPASLTFVGVSPPSQQIQLTNTGGGTLSSLSVTVVYPTGQPSGWLTAGVSGTAAPATVTVTASGATLSPGNYAALVRITAPGAANSPLDVPVSLTVPTPAPAIALGTNNIGFNAVQGGANPPSQNVTVTNAGGGTLSGLATSVSYAGGQPTGWLTAALGATTAPTNITLTAATGSLPAGSYSATVQVASGVAQNTPQTINVTFTVATAPAVITVQPTSLTFSGVSPANQPVQITNTGGGTLTGLVVSMVYPSGQPSGWLNTSLGGTTAPATLTVGASGAGLAAGTYTATVQIAAPGAANSPVAVPVQLTVPPPAISLGATTVGFNATQGSSNPAPQTVAVTNAGGATLSGLSVSVIYAVGQSTGWLSAALGATTAPTTVTLTASIGALQPGTYNATVRVASAVASNTPQDIAVTFTVGAAPPAIGAQPSGLAFNGVSPPAQQILITNVGGGSLTGLSVSVIYPAGGATGWITATNLSGTTAPATLDVTASGSGLASGNYTATIQISAPGASNSPLAVPVQLNVPAPAPAIALSLNTVGFNAVAGGGNPAAQLVTVTNSGGGTLSGLAISSISYAVGQPTGWLNAVLGATTAPTDITLTATTGSLPAGSYSATVQVTSGVAANSPQNITVTFTVAAAPATIGVQPTSLTFTGVSPAPQQVQITNTGGGTLSGLSVTTNYTSGQPSGWLSTGPSGTTAPATVTVTADGATLAPGTYNATVQIAAAGATNSPVDVPVTFTVPQSVPGVPTGLTATAVSSSQIDLAWTAASGTVTDYRIERKTGAGGTYAQIQIVTGTSFSDTGLSAGTDYYYHVQACNSAGCSAFSTEASATTQGSAPTSPTSLSAQGVSTSAIDLQWTHDGLLVTQFELERAPGIDPTNFQPLATPASSARSYQDTGLSPATTYVYRIRACALSVCSAWSNAASGTTQDTLPAPGGVTATALDSTQVQVTWNAVPGATEYRVRRQDAVGGANTQMFTVTAPTTAYIDTGLTRPWSYNYDVRACNASGCSSYSAVATVSWP